MDCQGPEEYKEIKGTRETLAHKAPTARKVNVGHAVSKGPKATRETQGRLALPVARRARKVTRATLERKETQGRVVNGD